MALKPLRRTVDQRIDLFMNETGERGCMVVYPNSTPSGFGDLDDAGSTVTIPTGGVGSPVGILMCDVVNRDLSRDRLNWHQDEVQIGSKVILLTKGMVRTNAIQGNPVKGSGGFHTIGGFLTMTQPADNAGPACVRFASARDTDGYAAVEVNLP